MIAILAKLFHRKRYKVRTKYDGRYWKAYKGMLSWPYTCYWSDSASKGERKKSK